MNMTSRSLLLIPVACALLALTACGNKGPLVMPQKPVPVEEQEVVPVDAPAADDAAAVPPTDGTEPAQARKPAEGTQP
jgi:predicted small lipoprotein YifL